MALFLTVLYFKNTILTSFHSFKPQIELMLENYRAQKLNVCHVSSLSPSLSGYLSQVCLTWVIIMGPEFFPSMLRQGLKMGYMLSVKVSLKV